MCAVTVRVKSHLNASRPPQIAKPFLPKTGGGGESPAGVRFQGARKLLRPDPGAPPCAQPWNRRSQRGGSCSPRNPAERRWPTLREGLPRPGLSGGPFISGRPRCSHPFKPPSKWRAPLPTQVGGRPPAPAEAPVPRGTASGSRTEGPRVLSSSAPESAVLRRGAQPSAQRSPGVQTQGLRGDRPHPGSRGTSPVLVTPRSHWAW